MEKIDADFLGSEEIDKRHPEVCRMPAPINFFGFSLSFSRIFDLVRNLTDNLLVAISWLRVLIEIMISCSKPISNDPQWTLGEIMLSPDD